MIGPLATRAEIPKSSGTPFFHPALIDVCDGSAVRHCMIYDVSDTKARIMLAADYDVPDEFTLVRKAGDARQRCGVFWRQGLYVWVQFLLEMSEDPAALAEADR